MSQKSNQVNCIAIEEYANTQLQQPLIGYTAKGYRIVPTGDYKYHIKLQNIHVYDIHSSITQAIFWYTHE